MQEDAVKEEERNGCQHKLTSPGQVIWPTPATLSGGLAPRLLISELGPMSVGSITLVPVMKACILSDHLLLI